MKINFDSIHSSHRYTIKFSEFKKMRLAILILRVEKYYSPIGFNVLPTFIVTSHINLLIVLKLSF